MVPEDTSWMPGPYGECRLERERERERDTETNTHKQIVVVVFRISEGLRSEGLLIL
jgi:hypothetical protein